MEEAWSLLLTPFCESAFEKESNNLMAKIATENDEPAVPGDCVGAENLADLDECTSGCNVGNDAYAAFTPVKWTLCVHSVHSRLGWCGRCARTAWRAHPDTYKNEMK